MLRVEWRIVVRRFRIRQLARRACRARRVFAVGQERCLLDFVAAEADVTEASAAASARIAVRRTAVRRPMSWVVDRGRRLLTSEFLLDESPSANLDGCGCPRRMVG